MPLRPAAGRVSGRWGLRESGVGRVGVGSDYGVRAARDATRQGARSLPTEAKEIYRERAATAECVNAIARNRGLRQIRVRGLGKARAVLLLFALAHNMMRTATLLEANRAANRGPQARPLQTIPIEPSPPRPSPHPGWGGEGGVPARSSIRLAPPTGADLRHGSGVGEKSFIHNL